MLPGDTVQFIKDMPAATAPNDVKGATQTRIITSRASATQLLLDTSWVNADPKQSDSGGFWHVPRDEATPYFRHVKTQWLGGQEVVFCFQLIGSGLMTSSKHIPLWVTKGPVSYTHLTLPTTD